MATAALSLPPEVEGRIHGSLRLAVERISWRVACPPDSSQVSLAFRHPACVSGRARAHGDCRNAEPAMVRGPQVRVKWWGEKGYGSLLRPAACAGLGPALTSSVFYSIRCSRPRLLEYFRDAASVRLDVVDERGHKIIAHAYVELGGRCTAGEAADRRDDETSECVVDGPVAMYAKDGSKVGELTVSLDVRFKRQAQRTSFELHELLSHTDPTLPLYPSHPTADNSRGLASPRESMLSASDFSTSVKDLSTVHEGSRETGGWSSAAMSSNATHATPQDVNKSSANKLSPQEPCGKNPTEGSLQWSRKLADESRGKANRTDLSLSSATEQIESNKSSHAMLMEEGAEAAERLVQMLTESENLDEAGDGAAISYTFVRPERRTLESVSEMAVAVENVDDCLFCDSSAIQRGGMSGGGSMVEVHSGSRLQGKDANEALEEGMYAEGKDVLDFSLDRTRYSAGMPADRAEEDHGVFSPAAKRRADVALEENDGSNVKVMEEMDVLSKLLQKGREMLQTLDRLADQTVSSPANNGVEAPVSADITSLPQAEADSKISLSMDDEPGSSFFMPDFGAVHAGVVDDLCRIGLDEEEEDANYASASVPESGGKEDQSANDLELTITEASTHKAAVDSASENFALCVHISLLAISGGRVTTLRPGDLVYVHAVLTVPSVGEDVIHTSLHEQLRLPVPPDLPEGAAVSVGKDMHIPLSSQQLMALRDFSGEGIGGDLEVRVLHQPRARVFGESGFKDVGQMKAVGVGAVKLEKVWASSRWGGIVHLKNIYGEDKGRKAATGKGRACGIARGKSNAQKPVVQVSTKAASRYGSLSQQAGAEETNVDRSVVGRLELAVSLVNLPSDEPFLSAKCNPLSTAGGGVEIGLTTGELKIQEHGQEMNDIAGDELELGNAPNGEISTLGKDQKTEGDDVWLLQLHDVSGITWTHTLLVMCRMVSAQTPYGTSETPPPRLKTCLVSRHGRAWNAGSIQLSVFQPAQSQQPVEKTARSLFLAGTGLTKPLVVLELWDMDPLHPSRKKLMGLVQMEIDAISGADRSMVSGCAVIIEGAFPLHSPFSGKDVGNVQVSLLTGAEADVQSIVQRYDTALKVKLAAQDKLNKLRSRQAENLYAITTQPEEDAKSPDQQRDGHEGRLVTPRDGIEHSCANEGSAPTAWNSENARSLPLTSAWALPRPLQLKYRTGARGLCSDCKIAKMTHSLTLTIVGIARLPTLATESSVTSASNSPNKSVRDSGDMMVYRPCGIYVRTHVPGDADETLTPVVPICSHLALHTQSTRSFVLPTGHGLLESVPILVDTPSWNFQVMYRPKGAPSTSSDRQIAHATLSTEVISELLSCDVDHDRSPVTTALGLPVCVSAETTAATKGCDDCVMRVRLTYEKTPYFGGTEERPSESLIARTESGQLQGEVEFKVSNTLQLRNFRMCGLKAAADILAAEHARCRLVPFDGPNTCIVLHFSPPPPWQKNEAAPSFHASETAVHSFCPVFTFSRNVAMSMTEETIEYLNSAVLVVEAWHRSPRAGFEEFQLVHSRCHDARMMQGVLHQRDLLMASASVPLQALLLRSNGISGWHILYTPDGTPAGAVDFTCALGVPALVHPALAPMGDLALGDSGLVSGQNRNELLVEVQLLLEEVLIDGLDEVDCAFMAAPDAHRTLEVEYSLCGLEESRSCSRFIGTKEAQRRRVAIDHCCSVTFDAGPDNLRRLVSEHVRVSCNVVQSNMAFALGVLELDLSPLVTRSQAPMDGQEQWLGGVHTLVQPDESRLLARLRLKAALRFRSSVVPVPMKINHKAPEAPGDPIRPHLDEVSVPDILSDSQLDTKDETKDRDMGTPVTICIERACDLELGGADGDLETFVTCNVTSCCKDGGISTKLIKTAASRNGCNPRWQHTDEVLMELEAQGLGRSRELIFEVWCAPITHEEDLGHCKEGEQDGERRSIVGNVAPALVGCARVDLFQIQRGGAAIDGWYHILDEHNPSGEPTGAIKIAVVNHYANTDDDTCDVLASLVARARSGLQHACSDWIPAHDDPYEFSAPTIGGINKAISTALGQPPMADSPTMSAQDLRESLRRNMSELDHIQLRLRCLHDPLASNEVTTVTDRQGEGTENTAAADSSLLPGQTCGQDQITREGGEMSEASDTQDLDSRILEADHSGAVDANESSDIMAAVCELSSLFEPQSARRVERSSCDASPLCESVTGCWSPCYDGDDLNRCIDISTSVGDVFEEAREMSQMSVESAAKDNSGISPKLWRASQDVDMALRDLTALGDSQSSSRAACAQWTDASLAEENVAQKGEKANDEIDDHDNSDIVGWITRASQCLSEVDKSLDTDTAESKSVRRYDTEAGGLCDITDGPRALKALQTPLRRDEATVSATSITVSNVEFSGKSIWPTSTCSSASKPAFDKILTTPSSESHRSMVSAASTVGRAHRGDSLDGSASVGIKGARLLQFDEDSAQIPKVDGKQSPLQKMKAKHVPSDAHLERIARILQLGL